MTSLLYAVQKDLGNQSRDLTRLVKQVKDILPQYSDDVVCEALIQSDEDVMRAVDLLLSAVFSTKSAKKKKDKKERQAASSSAEQDAPEAYNQHANEAAAASGGGDEGWGGWGDDPSYGGKEQDVVEVEREDRPKTPSEKQAAKLRKKLREIERIEERHRKGEKVDPLQLPKIEKKAEVEHELFLAEKKVREEEEEERRLQEQRLQEEAERAEQERQAAEAARQAEAQQRAAAQAAAEAQQRQAAQLAQAQQAQQAQAQAQAAALREAEAARRRQQMGMQQQQQQQVPQASQQQTPQVFQQQQQQVMPQQPPQSQPMQPPQQPGGQQTQAMGMELLSMLHKAQPDGHGYEQTRQMADQLSGGRGPVLRGNASLSSGGSAQPPPQAPRPEQQAQEYTYVNHGSLDRCEEDLTEGIDDATTGATDGQLDSFTNEYSTPLDISKISADRLAEAERIAKEIESGQKGGKSDWHEQTHRRSNGGDKGGKKGEKGGGKGRSTRDGGTADGGGSKGAGGKGSKGKSEGCGGGGPGRSELRSPDAAAKQRTGSFGAATPPAVPQTIMSSSRLNW